MKEISEKEFKVRLAEMTWRALVKSTFFGLLESSTVYASHSMHWDYPSLPADNVRGTWHFLPVACNGLLFRLFKRIIKAECLAATKDGKFYFGKHRVGECPFRKYGDEAFKH